MNKEQLELAHLRERARQWKKKNKSKIERLRSHKDLSINSQYIHDEVFAEIDCLSCANCCKTTGPLFTARDIDRISRQFNLDPKTFIQQYLRQDEDGDMVLQVLPCPFLDTDNQCRIYDIRPKACREYPHTDAHNQNQIFSLTLKNAEICPAVLQILEKLLPITVK
jgi:Fe-S-cluster containining protein